jgi:hypothetical protein
MKLEHIKSGGGGGRNMTGMLLWHNILVCQPAQQLYNDTAEGPFNCYGTHFLFCFLVLKRLGRLAYQRIIPKALQPFWNNKLVSQPAQQLYNDNAEGPFNCYVTHFLFCFLVL